MEKNAIVFRRVKERGEKKLDGIQAKGPLRSALDTALLVAKRKNN